MSGNWQHKILDLDIAPPPGVWTNIANQLDEGYHLGEINIARKMHDFEISPPASVLEKVLNNIVPDQVPKPKARIFSFAPRRAAIAALLVGLIAVTLIYFVRPESSSETQQSAATIIPSIPRSNTGDPTNSQTDNAAQENTLAEIETSSSDTHGDKKSEQPGNNISRTRNIQYAGLSPVLPASAISPISVSAPPIYDGNGDIIMDEELVSAPDENYIIVTSPSGEQTKISRKFLKMLSVMNGGTDNYYMNAENFEWKLRFEEWRSKLLQQASYIPTANNFLDIMDLKELLQEN